MPSVHPLVAFYAETAQDDRGRMLADILGHDDAWLEYTHDFIQWLFPLRERSGANPRAPVLDDGAIASFHASAALRARLRESFLRMLAFYGLEDDGVTVTKTARWNARKHDWFTQPTHNDLRISRILRSTALLGLRDESRRFMACLNALVANESDSGVADDALAYWRASAAT